MQTEIALFTMEAEYISLIQSIRDFIPLKKIMLDVSSIFGMKFESYEDNEGAIYLAKELTYRPLTKNLSIK